MRYKVRVGNDLPVQWSFFQDKAKTVPLSLSGRTLSVYLSTNTSKWKLSNLTVENNWIGFTIPGVDQISKYGTGLFNLTCIENEGRPNQHVIDFISPFLFVNQLEVSQSGPRLSDMEMMSPLFHSKKTLTRNWIKAQLLQMRKLIP